MGDWWDYYPPYEKTVRRKTSNGIKARSRRGDIGESWWSKRFVAVLESFYMGARLARGRSYARSGQVMDLDVQPGLVTARVQGSRPGPYEVRLGVKTLSARDWKRAEEAMARQAVFMARLLAGEMPREIEEAFATCRLSLFPASTRELDTACSCPDWANPCKHVAATYYILAEQFDDDPFLIFAWRGRTKDQLIERLRALRGAAGADQPEALEPGGVADLAGAEPLASCLASFWQAGPALTHVHILPRAAEVPDALLRRLGPAPAEIGGKTVAVRLAPLYRAMTAAAERRAFGEE